MKKIYVSIIILFVIICLTGCTKKDANFKLIIRESDWSGWSSEYVPDQKTEEFDVKLNKKYSADEGRFVFTIKKINKDSIVVKTSSVYSDKEDGIDLGTNKTEFRITKDKELELNTPTMDAGYIYYLKIEER